MLNPCHTQERPERLFPIIHRIAPRPRPASRTASDGKLGGAWKRGSSCDTEKIVGVVRAYGLPVLCSSTTADSENGELYRQTSNQPYSQRIQLPYKRWKQEWPENDAAGINVRMRAILCPDSMAFSFLPPDVNHYWAPETSDLQNESLPKATVVCPPLFPTESCHPRTHPCRVCMQFDATNGASTGWTCATSNHIPPEHHQPVLCSPTSHNFEPRSLGATLPHQLFTTSHGSAELRSQVEYQLSIIYCIILLQCLAHSPQPAS